MKLIFAIYNVLIRFISGFIPSKNIRRKLREQCIYTQICPKGAKYYLVKDNKEIPFKFVKYGLKIEVFGKNNKIIINPSAYFSDASLVIRGDNNVFKIGRSTACNNTKFHLYGNDTVLSVGNECLFSYDIEVWTGDGHALFKQGEDKPYNYGKDVIIGNHVWLGAYSKILKGANIPNNSVIGMGAMVNEAFTEEYTIIAGSPAKVIRTNVDWDGRAPEEI